MYNVPVRTVIVAAVMTVAALPCRAADPLISMESAKEIIDSRGADPLAGIWRFGGDGATLAFVPVAAGESEFDIIILDSPDMSVIPGQNIGRAVSTGKVGVYDATMAQNRTLGHKTVRCIITLGKDGRLSLQHYKQGYEVRLRRLLPYLFPFSVNRQDTRPGSVDGAVRLYPPTGQEGPVML